MSDLPRHGLMQQMNAHSHSGEYLEVLGKKAAADWTAGEHKTLTDAVVTTVKQAQLSPEQVKRVAEFANTAAYLEAFKKEGATHHVVDFPGGPADPAVILQDLNDGGGGSVFDRGTGDYDAPPKTASIESDVAERELGAIFGADLKTELPYANPHSEVIELKDKLAGAEDHLQTQLDGLEVMYADLGDRVYHQVKQAALSDVSLGDVMQAWSTVAPSADHIKVAFSLITPRLLRDGVFHTLEAAVASVDKTASARVVNTEHPLIVEFEEFCTVLSKLAETRGAQRELRQHAAHLDHYLKQASLADMYNTASRVSTGAGKAIRPFVEKTVGPTAGAVAEKVVSRLPEAAIGIGGMEAYTHMQNSPSLPARGARGAVDLVARNIPGTTAHLRHKYEVQSGQ
jgi:hypothetical protein